MSAKSNYNVLIVDDNQENCELFKRYLARDTKHSYKTEYALTGGDGIEKARSLHPDCILLDHFLPDMDSIEYVKLLREKHHITEPQIVVITNASDINSIRQHPEVRRYLKKVSLTPERLHEAVIQSIENARSSFERNRFEVLFNTLFHTSTSAMLISDKTGKISMVNSLCESFFQLPTEQLIGQSLFSILRTGDEESHSESYESIFNSASNQDLYRHTNRFADGSTRVLNQTVYFIEENGKRSAMLSQVEQSSYLANTFPTSKQEKSRRRFLRRESDKKIFFELNQSETNFKAIQSVTRNSLQVNSVLLNLQAQVSKDSTVRQFFEDALNRSQTISSALEELVMENGFATVNMNPYLRRSLDILSQRYSGGKIKMMVRCSSFALPYEPAILCGLIINELSINAFEHAFPDVTQDGLILVSMSNEEEPSQIVLSVEDNGVGLPTKFDLKNASSIGLMIVNSLVRRLKGKLEVRRQRGTLFRVVFQNPLAQAAVNSITPAQYGG